MGDAAGRQDVRVDRFDTLQLDPCPSRLAVRIASHVAGLRPGTTGR